MRNFVLSINIGKPGRYILGVDYGAGDDRAAIAMIRVGEVSEGKLLPDELVATYLYNETSERWEPHS